MGRFLWNQWFTELALGSGRGEGNRIVLGRKMIRGIKCSLYGNSSLHSCSVMMSNTALRKSTARALDGLRFLRLTGRLALMRVTQGSCDVWTPRWDQLAQRSSASRWVSLFSLICFPQCRPRCRRELACPCISGVTARSTFVTEAPWVSPVLLVPISHHSGHCRPEKEPFLVQALQRWEQSKGLKERAGPLHSVAQGQSAGRPSLAGIPMPPSHSAACQQPAERRCR